MTALALLDGTLVSGSRDKSLRTWDVGAGELCLNTQMEVAHKDWVNALASKFDQSEVYSAAKDGVVKVWRNKGQKMTCVAQIQGSAHSINAVAGLDEQYGAMFAFGGQEKQVKIWVRRERSPRAQQKPDQEMEEVFERAYLDRNTDNDEEFAAKNEEIKQAFATVESSRATQHQYVRSQTSLSGLGEYASNTQVRRR